MSAISTRFLSICVASAVLSCSSEPEDVFSNSCPNGAPSLQDGGCPPVASSSGGAIGTGGTGTGGLPGGTGGTNTGGGGGGISAGGAGATSNVDGGPTLCPVNGGGPTRTPLGSCTVLAYCDRTEFRLVCQNDAATCDCRVRGATTKTIPNDQDYCANMGDAGTRANIDAANAACSWNLDTTNFRP
jgi:hypothetical protein